ncbi:MAG: hypothetical protein ACI4CT_05985 [Lachnospiraceae bacterium]
MSTKNRKFADDGWAIWIHGDDRSTVYLNEWIQPKGKSYVDVSVRIYGAQDVDDVNIYVPFSIAEHDIEDLSAKLSSDEILRVLFNTNGVIDTEKNAYTSELRYDGRVVSLIALSEEIMKMRNLSEGTVITISLNSIREYLSSNEAYIIFRIPHRSLDEIFSSPINMGDGIKKMKEMISSPITTQRYGYSIRINEARLLPVEINTIEDLHNQKIRKALVTVSLDENYELNDSNCYRIRRLEEDLYRNYAPVGYECSNAIIYQWVEERDKNMKAHYNFYFNIVHNNISRSSIAFYLLIVLLVGIVGMVIYDLLKYFIFMI